MWCALLYVMKHHRAEKLRISLATAADPLTVEEGICQRALNTPLH